MAENKKIEAILKRLKLKDVKNNNSTNSLVNIDIKLYNFWEEILKLIDQLITIFLYILTENILYCFVGLFDQRNLNASILIVVLKVHRFKVVPSFAMICSMILCP